jgi:hypothetical protein
MIHEFKKPIPIVTEKGEEGYAIYVESGKLLENDCFTVVLCEGGIIRHYLSNQIKIHYNSTYDIKKIEEAPQKEKEKQEAAEECL